MAAFTADWKYRGEGNSSLVIANTVKRVVYRLRKVTAEEPKIPVETVKMEMERQMNFMQNVMSPLIGPSYLVPLKLVKLSEEFFDAVKCYTASIRPDHRVSKTIDVGHSFVVEMPDLCTVPLACTAAKSLPDHFVTDSTFSVEIKPKWGYLPSFDDVRGRVCRYCMHQFLKVKDGKWKLHSAYCPVDLFSGCRGRMTFALQELIKTPQNNIRLFKNDSVIWSNEVKGDIDSALSSLMCRCSQHSSSPSVLDRIIDVVIQCLRHSVTDDSCNISSCFALQTCQGSALSASHLCSSDCDKLPQQCVLANILRTQLLSDLDFDEIVSLHEQLNTCFDVQQQLRELSGIDGPFTPGWLQHSDGLLECSGSVKESLLQVKEFLVARSAKDCSIFISVCPLTRCRCCRLSNGDSENSTQVETDQCIDRDYSKDLACLALPDRHFVVVDSAGQHFVCCVSVIDLDPKRFDKIPFYLAEDQAVSKSYHECTSSHQSSLEHRN